MSRVLHLVRTALPPGVRGPDDLVVYVADSPAAEGLPSDQALWRLEPSHADGQARILTSHELCDLIFACDSVAVW